MANDVLCPKCGASWHAVRQMLASPEVEERVLAEAIIINCTECRKELSECYISMKSSSSTNS